MKKLFEKKWVLALTFFLMGGLAFGGLGYYFATQRLNQSQGLANTEEDSANPFDAFFNDDSFFKSRDPFQEMRRVQSKMLRQLQEEGPFNGFTKMEISSLGGVTQREDELNFYYDLDLQGQKPQKLEVQVEDGQLIITGEVGSKKEDDGSSHFYTSSFQRSFPIPPGVDAEKFKMEEVDGRLIIKLPKKASS